MTLNVTVGDGNIGVTTSTKLQGAADGAVENTDQSYQDTVAPGGTLVIPDINITKNDDSVVTSPAAINLDLRIIDPCNIPATWAEFVAEYGRGYKYPIYSGHQTSYRTGDDKWIEDNVFAPIRDANSLKAVNSLTNDFLTLNNNNSFSTLFRFTNNLGGQDFDGTGGSLVDYVVDNLTGIGWFRKVKDVNIATWNDAIDDNLGSDHGGSGTDAALLGFTNWFTPSENMLRSIDGRNITLGVNSNFRYFPFSIGGVGGAANFEFGFTDYSLWSSTVHADASTSARAFRVSTESMGSRAKSGGHERVICRKHF